MNYPWFLSNNMIIKKEIIDSPVLISFLQADQWIVSLQLNRTDIMLEHYRLQYCYQINNGMILLELKKGEMHLCYSSLSNHFPSNNEIYQLDIASALQQMERYFPTHQELFQYLSSQPYKIILVSEYQIKISIEVAYETKVFCFPMVLKTLTESQSLQMKLIYLSHRSQYLANTYKVWKDQADSKMDYYNKKLVKATQSFDNTHRTRKHIQDKLREIKKKKQDEKIRQKKEEEELIKQKQQKGQYVALDD